MKRLFLLSFIALAIVGCEDKQPYVNTDKEDNSIPYWWSPAGKKYVCEGSTSEYDWVADVLYFYKKDSIVMYSTLDKDYSFENARHPEYGTYKLTYPNITIIFGYNEERPLKFIDTSKIYSEWWEQTYLILK